MIFNSYAFLFAFLPVALAGFHLIGRRRHPLAIGFLAMASLFFYAWWNVAYLPLLLGSVLMNYAFGRVLAKWRARWIVTAAVAANLGLLGYFKYANFLVDTANDALSLHLALEPVVLPLAISFFTFQQIAFVVDVYRGEVRETNFTHYLLFVSFFPQLIAGPIVHHGEMMPQFARTAPAAHDAGGFALGLTLFCFGLFKKVCIADRVAAYADPVFRSAEAGEPVTFLIAWGGVLSYHFQIYFDFSGYSDMALGLACMFGIRLPVNFYSPYKARNIIEFWHRWNMTLSRFLRDYVYIPLGGNRRGPTRRYVNLMATMLLGGLWHGAGWNFVIWGGLHGLYLIINHGWHALMRRLGRDPDTGSATGRAAATLLTFLAVALAWTFFRAESFAGAAALLAGMAGLNGVAIPAAVLAGLGPAGDMLRDAGITELATGGVDFAATAAWVIALSAVVWLLPNSVELLARYRPALNLPETAAPGTSITRRLANWAWTPVRAATVGVMAFVAFKTISAGAPSPFIYFIF